MSSPRLTTLREKLVKIGGENKRGYGWNGSPMLEEDATNVLARMLGALRTRKSISYPRRGHDV